MKKEEEEQKTL